MSKRNRDLTFAQTEVVMQMVTEAIQLGRTLAIVIKHIPTTRHHQVKLYTTRYPEKLLCSDNDLYLSYHGEYIGTYRDEQKANATATLIQETAIFFGAKVEMLTIPTRRMSK